MNTNLIIGLAMLILSALFAFIIGAIVGLAYMTRRGFLPACVFLDKLVSAKDANDFVEKHLDDKYANNELDAWYCKREARLFFAMYQLGYSFRRLKNPQSGYLDALEDDIFLRVMMRLADKYIKRCSEENQ